MRLLSLSGSLLICAGLLAGGALALGSGGAKLQLVKRDPLTLRGSAFKPGVKVTTTVRIGERRLVRVRRTSPTGGFTATFSGVAADPCTLDARAAGGGMLVVWKAPERMCPVPLGQEGS